MGLWVPAAADIVLAPSGIPKPELEFANSLLAHWAGVWWAEQTRTRIAECVLAQFIAKTSTAAGEVPERVFEVVDRAMAGQSKRTRRIVLGRFNPFGRTAEEAARELNMSYMTFRRRSRDAQLAILAAVRGDPVAHQFMRDVVRRSQDDGNE